MNDWTTVTVYRDAWFERTCKEIAVVQILHLLFSLFNKSPNNGEEERKSSWGDK